MSGPVDDETDAGPDTERTEGNPNEGTGPNEAAGRDPAGESEWSQGPRASDEHDTAPRPTGREPSSPEPEPGAETGEESSEGATWKLFVRDIITSVLAVAVVGGYLFAVSGVWPPLVAVESDSMVPNMQINDLVFVMEEERFPGGGAQHGVVTARVGKRTGYTQFGKAGDVIVYEPGGNGEETPIIHRAMFWVEAGENWCKIGRVNYIGGLDPDSQRCIADHAGFITKGDNNANYDQALGLSPPVKPEWIVGTAEFRIPGLGWIRLQSAG